MRVPVISADNIPLMPTKPSRARRWIKEGKAIGNFNKLGIFYVQLISEPSSTKTQEIVIGLDPGKMFSGIAVQTKKYTLQMLHLVLPFKTVKKRMKQRAKYLDRINYILFIYQSFVHYGFQSKYLCN